MARETKASVEVTNPLKGKSAKQLTELLDAKSKELADIFFVHADDVDGEKVYDFTAEQIEDVRRRNDELTEIGKALDEVRYVEVMADNAKSFEQRATDIRKQPREMPPRPVPFSMSTQSPSFGRDSLSADLQKYGSEKTLGQRFIESKVYKSSLEQGITQDSKINFSDNGFEFKTTMTTAAGFAPANDRTNVVVPFALRRPVLQDFIPSVVTDLDSIRWMEETTFTNLAAGTAENAAMPESALAYTERSSPVELIGTFIPVTEQQLEVPEFAQSLIDNRLMTMYTLKEESDLLTGNGTSPNIRGFLNTVGIQTQDRGTDPSPDAIYKLITKLRGGSGAGFVEPGAILMHPNNWQTIRLLKTADGIYIWGSPVESGPERMWGKPIVPSTVIAAGTALTGDWQLYSQIYRKRGARVDVGLINDDFIRNKMTIKVTGRLTLCVYRAAAFGTVTNLN